MERLFIQNLRSKDIGAQVLGKKKPLYEGHLLDRDVHISDFTITDNSEMGGGEHYVNWRSDNGFGVHVSSILRGRRN